MLRPCCPMTKKVGRPVAHKSTYRRAQFPSRAARAICCHARADFHLRRVCVIGYDETSIARGIPPSQDCVLSRNYQCIISRRMNERAARASAACMHEYRVCACAARMNERTRDVAYVGECVTQRVRNAQHASPAETKSTTGRHHIRRGSFAPFRRTQIFQLARFEPLECNKQRISKD